METFRETAQFYRQSEMVLCCEGGHSSRLVGETFVFLGARTLCGAEFVIPSTNPNEAQKPMSENDAGSFRRLFVSTLEFPPFWSMYYDQIETGRRRPLHFGRLLCRFLGLVDLFSGRFLARQRRLPGSIAVPQESQESTHFVGCSLVVCECGYARSLWAVGLRLSFVDSKQSIGR